MKQKIIQGHIYAILVAFQHCRFGEEGPANSVSLSLSNGEQKTRMRGGSTLWLAMGRWGTGSCSQAPCPERGGPPGKPFLSPAKCRGSLLQNLKQGRCWPLCVKRDLRSQAPGQGFKTMVSLSATQKAKEFSMVLMGDKSKAEPGNKRWHEEMVKKNLVHVGRID